MVTLQLYMRIKSHNCKLKTLVVNYTPLKSLQQEQVNTFKLWKVNKDGLDNLQKRRRTRTVWLLHNKKLVIEGREQRGALMSTAKGRTYNVVEQMLEAHKNQGKMLVLDSCFPTLPLLEDARNLRNDCSNHVCHHEFVIELPHSKERA